MCFACNGLRCTDLTVRNTVTYRELSAVPKTAALNHDVISRLGFTASKVVK